MVISIVFCWFTGGYQDWYCPAVQQLQKAWSLTTHVDAEGGSFGGLRFGECENDKKLLQTKTKNNIYILSIDKLYIYCIDKLYIYIALYLYMCIYIYLFEVWCVHPPHFGDMSVFNGHIRSCLVGEKYLSLAGICWYSITCLLRTHSLLVCKRFRLDWTYPKWLPNMAMENLWLPEGLLLSFQKKWSPFAKRW